MNIIIGGVERKISQVETYAQYETINDNDTVGDILDKSRADRLLNKIVEKRMLNDINLILGGKNTADIPEVKYGSKKILGQIKGAYEIAKDIEKAYAIQAREINESF